MSTVKISELDETLSLMDNDYFVVDNGLATKKLKSTNGKQYLINNNFLRKNDVVNNATTTTTDVPLSANIGKSLQDQVNNLKNIGRFLAIWNSSTGLPTTNPETMPYTYRTGDYYRVGMVSSTTNYKPSGTTYNNVASTTEETENIEVGSVYYFDGTNWLIQPSGGGGLVQDVQVGGTSIVNSQTGIANIVSGTNIKTINNTSLLGSGNISVGDSPYMPEDYCEPNKALCPGYVLDTNSDGQADTICFDIKLDKKMDSSVNSIFVVYARLYIYTPLGYNIGPGQNSTASYVLKGDTIHLKVSCSPITATYVTNNMCCTVEFSGTIVFASTK